MSFPWKFALLWSTELSSMLLMQRSIIFRQSSFVTSLCQSTKQHRLIDKSVHRSGTSRRVYYVTRGYVYARNYNSSACTCSCSHELCDECVTSQAGGKNFIWAWLNTDQTRCSTATVDTTNLFEFIDVAAFVFFQYSVLFIQEISCNFAVFILD